MEAGQQQQQQQHHSWKLNVHAKAKNFNFKLVASNFLPNSKYFPFSLKFKYCRFFIHLNSQTFISPNPQKPKSFKSKLHRFLQRLRRRRSKNNRVTSSKPKNKATISQSSVVLGNLLLFLQSIYQGDKDGIFILDSEASLIISTICPDSFGGLSKMLPPLPVFIYYLSAAKWYGSVAAGPTNEKRLSQGLGPLTRGGYIQANNA
ncbi:hypothetical protein KY290_005353 [Solanum tuberosum]|uniref:Uncharacterized protein n=1 Tax=Solanum tuberosum TaxID=4113 RepID=A0ABQ7WDY7_SOLTU|nr:hypothetical protein KY289_005744 [Solanum tuberosum]KAH0778926.1 hypothetical protein KY290_005353 [Solanum tuberosum]